MLKRFSTADISPTTAWVLLSASLLGVVAYHLPWHVHDVAAFTLNAFDLAEWVSLHPTTRAESPALLSSILLRLPLVLLAGSIALGANFLRDERLRWVIRGVALLVALRLNPPVEFYRAPGEVSLNEQHLAYFTAMGLSLVLMLIVVGQRIRPVFYPVMAGLWVLIGGLSLEGLARATRIVESLQIEVAYGAGIYLMIGLVVGVIGFSVYRMVGWQVKG